MGFAALNPSYNALARPGVGWIGRLAMSWLWGRSVIRAVALVGLVAGSLTLPISSPAVAAGPSDTIRQFYVELLDTMQHATQLGVKGRYQKLEGVVFRTFDVPFMARLSI